MIRSLGLLIAAAAATVGCTTPEIVDPQAIGSCLYTVKYEGRMLKWHACETPPAMVSKRLSTERR